MRLLVITAAFFLALSSHAVAAERLFICDAHDSFERKSTFEINIDSGAIQVKAFGSSDWKALYDKKLSCGLKIPVSVSCRRHLVHNLDDPQRPYDAATDEIRCLDRSGRPLIDLNGNLEINRSGDGRGTFVCGQLTSRHLLLENCKATGG